MSGSKGARASPDLIAACHVFHRLSMPRHPSEALMRLIVLSKTHAWGRYLQPLGTKRLAAPTHALCHIVFADNDVFSGPSSKPQGGPDKPFNSRCHFASAGLARRWKLVSSRSRDASTKPRKGAWEWWSQTGSNRRPHACKARALPTELWPQCEASQRELSFDLSARGSTECGGPRRTRTADLTLIRRVL